MRKPHKLESIIEAVEPVIKAEGYYLVDVVWGSSFNRRALTFFVDKPSGVLLDECQAISHQIGILLEERDLVAGSYVLEVSSPGAERPLKETSDFERFSGRYALIVTREPLPEAKNNQVFGYLRGLLDDVVMVEVEAGKVIHIPLVEISKARLAIKF